MRQEVNVICALLFLAVTAASCGRNTPTEHPSAEAQSTVFVFVQIPESLMPIDRGTKYEDPLDAALKAAKLGEVTGGGSQLGELQKDGTRGIDWVGIDVEVTDLERGIPFIKSELLRLGAPPSTVLEFNRAGAKVKEQIR